jgi:hypothetical protein
MEGEYDGLLEYLAQGLDDCKDFPVVAQKEDSEDNTRFKPGDIPVVEIFSDDSDDEICMIRKSEVSKSKATLNLKSLYETLQTELRANPNYSLMISEWFKLEGGFKGRLDMPISGVEIDTEKEVVRLLF